MKLKIPPLLSLLILLLAGSAHLALSAEVAPSIGIKKIVMMLNIVSKEYQEGVSEGKVVNETEYQESMVFLEQVFNRVKSIAEAIDSEAEKKISAQLSFLIQEVKDKKAPAEIRKLAGAIQSDLQNIFKVEIFITPNEPVSLAEGKKIYDANCKVCHGLSGNGDGPLALQLNPKPAVLSNPKITSDDVTKPYDNFQIISVGVGGTSMLGWAETMSEMDIWNVTYYIRSFSNKNMKLPETPVSSAADTTGSAEKKLDVIFADIRNLLDLSLSSAKAKNGKKGADLAMDSYLIYENLEAGLKAKHKNLALRLESSFGEFQSKVRSDAPLAQVEAVYNSIQKDLVEAEELLKKKIGFTGLFTQSISIIIP